MNVKVCDHKIIIILRRFFNIVTEWLTLKQTLSNREKAQNNNDILFLEKWDLLMQSVTNSVFFSIVNINLNIVYWKEIFYCYLTKDYLNLKHWICTVIILLIYYSKVK